MAAGIAVRWRLPTAAGASRAPDEHRGWRGTVRWRGSRWLGLYARVGGVREPDGVADVHGGGVGSDRQDLWMGVSADRRDIRRSALWTARTRRRCPCTG